METEVTEEEANNLVVEFKDRFTFLYQLFDGKPFHLPPDEKGHERVSAAIYDAAMVAINELWELRDSISIDRDNVKLRMSSATGNADQILVLTGQRNTANAVKERIGLLRKILCPE